MAMPTFVPLPVKRAAEADIRSDLQRGPLSIVVCCAASAVELCGARMRTILASQIFSA